MKYTNIYIWALMLGIFTLSSCNKEDDTLNPVISSGEADFTKYISVGNSLTAGFANNGLYNEGIENGFVTIISNQFKLAGGGDFYNPLFPAGEETGTGRVVLEAFDPFAVAVGNNDFYNNETGEFGTDGITDQFSSPSTSIVTRDLISPPYTEYTGANLNNFGIPGLTVSAIGLPNYADLNPYFARLAETGTSYTDFIDAKGGDATFFSCWLGNNDVLGYALAGGTDGSLMAPTSITDEAIFTSLYGSLIDGLTTNGAKGIVATIPNVTSAAHFTTITEAALLQGVNLGLPEGVPTAFTEVYITTDAGVRPAEEGDLFLLALQANYGTALAGGQGLFDFAPFTDEMVLDKDEVAEILAATEAFNQIIINKANEKDLAIFDTNAFLDRLIAQEYLGNAQFLGLGFITGGLFSLDGIHFTPRGNAFAANEMIMAINAKYGSNVPLVNPNDYPGVVVMP